MIVYLDFEANGSSQVHEIISIGAITEDGRKFYSLVKPHNKLDKKIKELTHISQQEAENAPSIEEVLEKFFKWCPKDPSFLVYGDSDGYFIKASISLTEDSFAIDKLQYIYDHLIQADHIVAEKFHREAIGLRSAYLTMREAATEPVEQNHNALEDAEMLKYVWEHIREYEFPENGKIIKVPRKDMSYSKKASLKADPKFYVPIKVWINGKKRGYKEWIFPNVRAASGMFCDSKDIKKRVQVMNDILAAAEVHGIYKCKHIEVLE